ncbi:peroxiredoxins-like protein [Hydrogenobaculum sp. HO]|nr:MULTISPECIES: DsrE family protein [unclassified Hydrogenobaculum]AGG15393.1 peroxiredoxins-like protein [Hydrogenobaculum sp. HO]
MTGELINPQAGAPFFLATAATTMDFEVEMVITSEAGFLLMKDNAKKVKVRPGVEQTVYDFIKMAKEAGVKVYLCVPSLDLTEEYKREDVNTELCDGIIGGAAFLDKVMSGEYAVITL